MASMVIRGGIPGDEVLLMSMGERMWHESDHFKRHPHDLQTIKDLSHAVNTNPYYECFVAELNGKPVGMWVGYMHRVWFSHADVMAVSDLVFYVDKEHRGTSAAIRLLRAVETWGAAMGAVENTVGLSSGIDTEKTTCFFEKMGYTHGASIMVKELA
jgi:GNAT superfamily N-acetyltransferase